MAFPPPPSSSSPWELASLGFGFQEEKKCNAANAGFSSSGHHHHPASAALLSSSLSSSSSYNDHSNEQNLLPDGLSDKFLLHFKCGRSGTELPFPVKLHSMLDFVHDQGLSSIVSWQCHGRSFTVHKQKEFVDIIMKHYFKQTKFPSFQRQLNLYGFKRLTSGKDKGSYYHEFFLRQKRFLCYQINRVKIKGTKVRQASTPNSEPDFYSMTFLPVAHHDDTTTSTTTGGAAHTTQEEAPAAPQAPNNTRLASPPPPPPPNPLPPTSTLTGGEDVQETLEELSSSSLKAVMDPSPTPKMMFPTTGLVAPMPLHLPPPPCPAPPHSVLPSAAETPPQRMMKKSVIDPSKDRINTILGPNGLLAPTSSREHAPGGGDGRRLTATSTTTLPSPTRRVNHSFVPHQQGDGDVLMGGSSADPVVTGRPTPPPARRNSSSLCMMRPLPPPPLPVPIMESSFLQTKILAGSIQQIFSPCSTSTSKDTTTSTQKRQQEVAFGSVGSQQVLKKKVIPPIAEAPQPSTSPCGQQHDVGPLMKMKYSPVLMKTSSSSSSEEPSSSSSEEPSSASSYSTSSSSSWWVPPPLPFQQQDQQHQAAAGALLPSTAVASELLLPPPPRNLYANEDFDAFDDEILDSLMRASQASSQTLSLSPVPITTTAASRTTNTTANIKTRPSAAVDNEYDQQKPGAVAPGHQLVSFSVDPTCYYHHHHVI